MKRILISAIIIPFLSHAAVSFEEPSSEANLSTVFYQNTIKEKSHLDRASSLLREAAKYRILHVDYVESAILEIRAALENNTTAKSVNPFKMVKFDDMFIAIKDRLNLLSRYYEIVKYKRSLKTSSRYIYGGELKGYSATSSNYSNFQKTISILEEISNNLATINRAVGRKSTDRIKGLKYLDYNKRML